MAGGSSEGEQVLEGRHAGQAATGPGQGGAGQAIAREGRQSTVIRYDTVLPSPAGSEHTDSRQAKMQRLEGCRLAGRSMPSDETKKLEKFKRLTRAGDVVHYDPDSSARGADVATTPAPTPAHQDRRRRVARNVLALGAVSLVTDVSSEMVTAILPIYLTLGLGLSPLGLGFVDGLYTGVTAFVRLAGGQVADRTQRRKWVAGLGYGLSAASKPLMLAAGASIGWLAVVIGIDRTGKGLRTAPRDALISLSSSPDAVGRAFGLHRAMDTAGALAGPLVAFAVLWAVPGGYDAVFVVSACFAVAALVMLALLVEDHRERLADRKAVALRAVAGLLRGRSYRRASGLAVLLGLVTASDAFVFLLLQRRLDVAIGYFPLLPLGTAAVYLVLAAPLGRLADRVGRWRVFLVGNLALAGVYAALLSPIGGFWLLGVSLCLHGSFYAATDGVLVAVVAPSLPAVLRTSGIALVQTGRALAGLTSSVVFGAIWTLAGPSAALTTFLAALLVILVPATVWQPAPNGPVEKWCRGCRTCGR